MKARFLGVVFLSIISFTFSFAQKSKNFDYGTLKDDSIYTNSYFNLKMDIPSSWHVQSKEEVKQIMKSGENLVTGDDEKLKALVKAAEITTANFLTVLKYERGAPVDFNPSFILMAENISSSPGIKSGADYLFHTRKFMKQTQLNYKLTDEDFKSEVFGGKTFHKMHAEIDYSGVLIQQDYYATIINGFCLSFISSYIDEEQNAELLKIIGSMQFKK
ncbi:conserved hypothetical protein [Sporocytophaga myxococcoides]|uniref:Uncharacterized protein n=1 Tax=Sporocytophaga myxococcoides TaxID=153721 RepID=A0A098LF45_9BACT|nr:hypothetical protein [Sporocytophaga myxococcoides]GAL85575.1 conserved hypothetical protein [Sporocytophaga myxococcoides]